MSMNAIVGNALSALILCSLFVVPTALPAQNTSPAFNDAKQALDRGEYARAESQFRALVTANPTSADALDDLGIALQSQGKEREAMAVFERVLKIKRLPDAVAMLAVDFCSNHQFDRALPLLQEAKAKLHDSNLMATLGPCFLDSNQPESAVPIYEALVKSRARPVGENLANLIRAYFDLSRKLVATLPDVPGGMTFARAIDEARKNGSLDAEGAFSIAYSQAPYLDPSMSITELINLLPSHSKDPALLYILGIKTAEQAETLFQQLQNEAPDAIEVQQLTAEFKDFEGDRDGAIRTYEQIVAQHPNAPASVHFALGLLYAERQRWQDALAQYRVASPDGKGSLYITERTSECLLHLSEAEAVERMLKDIVHGEDAPFWALRDYGEAEEQQDHTETALEYLKRASALEPSDASIHYHLSRLYKKLRHKDAAAREMALFRQLSTEQ